MDSRNEQAEKHLVAPIPPAPGLRVSEGAGFSLERVRELFAALEVPFKAKQVEWRVTNTTKNGQRMRGQVVPYADQRAYTDRLNVLFTPAGWTRKYAIYTSASFERTKDQKIVAKVLVACELTIFGLGSHSATGEEFADNENALTAAEAQAFKRAASCFGLGRYLYNFTGTWVDLDDYKRPKSVPQLAAGRTGGTLGWARAGDNLGTVLTSTVSLANDLTAAGRRFRKETETIHNLAIVATEWLIFCLNPIGSQQVNSNFFFLPVS